MAQLFSWWRRKVASLCSQSHEKAAEAINYPDSSSLAQLEHWRDPRATSTPVATWDGRTFEAGSPTHSGILEDDQALMSAWAVDLACLDPEVRMRRCEIIAVLVEMGLVDENLGPQIERWPRTMEPLGSSFKAQDRVHTNNFLWLPDQFSACFVDYLNFRVLDGFSLRETLEQPFTVANCHADLFRNNVPAPYNIRNLLELSSVSGGGDGSHHNTSKLATSSWRNRREDEDNSPSSTPMLSTTRATISLTPPTSFVFYSFCLERAVLLEETQHCARCHGCFHWRYSHCPQCDRCSFGMGLGKCDNCGYVDSKSEEPNISICEESAMWHTSRNDGTSGLAGDCNSDFSSQTSVKSVGDLFGDLNSEEGEDI